MLRLLSLKVQPASHPHLQHLEGHLTHNSCTSCPPASPLSLPPPTQSVSLAAKPRKLHFSEVPRWQVYMLIWKPLAQSSRRNQGSNKVWSHRPRLLLLRSVMMNASNGQQMSTFGQHFPSISQVFDYRLLCEKSMPKIFKTPHFKNCVSPAVFSSF